MWYDIKIHAVRNDIFENININATTDSYLFNKNDLTLLYGNVHG